ncbi:MAG TPA: hypothetical protein VGG97_17870 [Bryobacteraceae bacterium]
MLRNMFVFTLIQPTNETDEIRAELETILASAAFLRSERLSQFLRFICEMTLKGEGAKLNEYVIAHEVFGRGCDYSPNEDSVVRRQAHSLRQKLHDYYAGEGSKCRVRIELPIGRYFPAFVPVEPQATAPPAVPHVIQRNRSKAVLLAAAIAFVALGWIVGYFANRSRPLAAVDPALAEIWGAWLSDPSGAVICFSNPMTAVVKQFSFSLPPDPLDDPPRIPVMAEQAALFRRYFELPPGENFYLYPAKSQSKTGEALGSVTLTSMLTRAGIPVRATQSRFLSWDNFRKQNLILLGHDEANRWLDPILDKLPFRMATTDGVKDRRITDVGSTTDRPMEFYLEKPSGEDHVSRDYALVSMITGVDGRHQLLLINGLNTEGTQIAMEYLCDPVRVRGLITRFRQSMPQHRGPWHFQLVLRTEVRDQVPTTADLLVLKVLP